MPISDSLTLALMREYLGVSLGSSGVSVELGAQDYDAAIQDACDAMTRYMPLTISRVLPAVSGATQAYPLDPAEHVGLVDVTNVQFVHPYMSSAQNVDNPFALEHRANAGDMSYGEYANLLSGNEQASRVFSADPDWTSAWVVNTDDPDPENHYRQHVIYVGLPPYGTQYDVSYTYTMAWAASDGLLRGLPAIPLSRNQWFKKFALARCKQILTRVRGKFQGIPDDGSGVFSTDYAELAQEGREDEAALLEDLHYMQPQASVVTG